MAWEMRVKLHSGRRETVLRLGREVELMREGVRHRAFSVWWNVPSGRSDWRANSDTGRMVVLVISTGDWSMHHGTACDYTTRERSVRR